MVTDFILHALFSSLLGQAFVPSTHNPPSATSPSATGGAMYRPEVFTDYGTFRGIRKTIGSNVVMDTFFGIPYAMPPVGKKFTIREAATIIEIKHASKFGDECHQVWVYKPLKVGDKPLPQREDCLFLNIYKPVIAESVSLPVMVWIHGGGYTSGAGTHYDGSDLALNGVMVVTINYRLDVLGFLSTQDDAMPGNYGMMDQVLALMWIKENIIAFGGDPDRVTIFGESAGSTSVSLLVLSPLAKGLFTRAIMESGVSLSPWAIHRPLTKVTPSQMASLIGSAVGCVDTDSTKKLKCLRGVKAIELIRASENLVAAFDYEISLAPVVETKFGFLPDLPSKLWAQNKFNHVDTIRGFNQAESGGSFAKEDTGNFTKQNFVDKLNRIFKPYAIINKDTLINEMLEKYVGSETKGQIIISDLISASSDFQFKGPTLIEADIESKLCPEKNHYVYEFAHKSGLSNNPAWISATHFEEIPFVFGIDLDEFQSDSKIPTVLDKMLSNQLQILWANFSKYGDPTKVLSSGAEKWNAFINGNGDVFQIKDFSRMTSFANSLGTYFYSKILNMMDSSFVDSFIVG